MADYNTNLNINVNTGNAEEALNGVSSKLDNIQSSQTRVTQSTKSFTKETKSLNDGLLQNGGAMGLLSAATGGLAMDFKDGIEAVEGLGISMKGLRGAIIATGIGALAILVLELVTNWEKWSDVIDGSKSKLEAVNKELDVTRQRYEDLQYAGDLAIEIMELEGKSLEEIAKQRRANFEEQRENLIQQLELEKEALSERIKSYTMWSTLTKGLIGDQEELEKAIAKVADIEDKITKLTDKNYVDELKTKALAAQAATNKKLKEQEANTKAVTAAQQELNATLSAMAASVKSLENINDQLREITLVDLTSAYGKMKVLQDSFYQNRDALLEVNKQIEKYKNLSRLATKEQKAEYDLNVQKSQIYKENVTRVEELIEAQKTLIDIEDAQTFANFKMNVEVIKLTDNYDELSKSVAEYERNLNFGQEVDTTAKIERQNFLLNKQLELINKTADITRIQNQTKLGNIGLEFARLEDEQNQIILSRKSFQETYLRLITQGQDEQGAKEGAFEAARQQLRDSQDLKDQEVYKRYFEIGVRLTDFNRQQLQLEGEMRVNERQLQLDLNQAFQDVLVQQELDALDLKMSAQEEYFNKVQILNQNVFGFMDALQNEQIIKSKDLRNVLLVAQKGAEIAQIVMGTVRENSMLKQRAGEYATNAALYAGLSSAFAAIDPVSSASYGAAATSYALAGSKSLAQIPINWKLAGTGIAGILATTLTSWNRGSDGGGGQNAGGAGGGGAQFNIVGSSGENQLAAQIAAQQNQPVNAYVVGSDMTTQQALDRNRVSNATFLSFIPFIFMMVGCCI
jgi:hypothetical protein